MWNPEDFDVKKHSNNGEWCELVNPATGEPLYIEIDGEKIYSRVKLLGPKSKAGIQAKAEAERKIRQIEEKKKRLEKKKELYIPSDDDIAANELSDVEYLKAMTVEWEGIPAKSGKGQADLNDDEMEHIYSSDGIRTQLIGFSVNPVNFMKA